jgi:hypothetical protein
MSHQTGDLPDVPEDSPDPLGDPEVDEARAVADDDVAGDEEDPYQMRSMPAQPNPTADDPASDLNF